MNSMTSKAGKATDGLLDKILELQAERDKLGRSLEAVVALCEMYPDKVPTEMLALAMEERLI